MVLLQPCTFIMNHNPLFIPVLLLFASHVAVANEIITETKDPQGWIIQTESSTYQIAVNNIGDVVPVYYGPSAQYTNIENLSIHVDPEQGSTFREVPYRGGFIRETPAIEAVVYDHTRDIELFFQSAEIMQIDGMPTLKINMTDPTYDISVSSFIRVLADLDLIEKWIEVKNQSAHDVLMENIQSGSVRLPRDQYELNHLSGTWGREFLLQKTRLTPGVKTIQTREFTAHENPPWFAVGPVDQLQETSGNVWFGNVHWSGNWRIDFDCNIWGDTQIIGGVNFWDTAITLAPDRQWTSPKMVFGFSPNGLEGASQRMNDYVLTHVLRPSFRETLRPVLYNSWYATTFNVNEAHQLALAKIAKEIGVVLFVIDDGWFKGRKNDRAGLGDWTVDLEKFPNGLKPMIDQIHAMDLDFGIWIEPEMVNPDSDLYRAHPDWIFYYPNRTKHEGRHQYMLNLVRADVCKYLYDSISSLLEENDIEFIKWDRNRSLTEPGSLQAEPEHQREGRIRYIENLYQLIADLEKRFPDVLFEVCSGGGGRNDIGIFSWMDQIWTSDNTDPLDRLFIQYGFSYAYPAKLMVSWVTDEDWHGMNPSLEFRFHSSMSGVLGIGTDLTTWSDEERAEAAKLIKEYKTIQPIVQQGRSYRLVSPFDTDRSAVQYVSRDLAQSVVFLYKMLETASSTRLDIINEDRVRLRGLDTDTVYQYSGLLSGKASGKTLMNLGISWSALRGSLKSGILHLQKIQ